MVMSSCLCTIFKTTKDNTVPVAISADTCKYGDRVSSWRNRNNVNRTERDKRQDWRGNACDRMMQEQARELAPPVLHFISHTLFCLCSYSEISYGHGRH